MMNSESVGKKILQITIGGALGFRAENLLGSSIWSKDLSDSFFFNSFISDILCCSSRFLSRVDENEELILSSLFHDFVVGNIIHSFKAFNSFLLGDTDKFLTKGTWTIRRIEEK